MDKPKQRSPNPLNTEQINRLLLEINTKVDANVYWLTTLLQNLILSIDTLNAKYAKLDQRLTFIEGFTVAKNNHLTERHRLDSNHRRFSSSTSAQITRQASKNLGIKEPGKFESINEYQDNLVGDLTAVRDRGRRVTYAENMLQVNWQF